MKLVVADASPIHYLVLVGAVHVLPKLFAKVIAWADFFGSDHAS